MPPKKKYLQRPTQVSDLNDGKEEKENMQLRQTKCTKKLTKLNPVKKTKADKLFSQSLIPQINECTTSQTDINVKPPGFWSKKLQDLEDNETKIKKCGLYEFSGTDESEASYKTTKKQKQKARSQKKRQPVMPKFNKRIAKISKKKTEEIEKKALGRNQVMLIKERKLLADEGKKFTFSLGMQSLGITSTPAMKKDNLVGASNFLFLSPIIKDDEYCNNSTQCLPRKLKADDDDDGGGGTPKISTKLKRLSYKRVLRNGKILGT